MHNLIVGTTSEKEQLTSPVASQSTDAAPVQLSKSARKRQQKKALKQSKSATIASEDGKATHGVTDSNQPTDAASSADISSSKPTQVKLKTCFGTL